ncbi:MAG: DivIVA domain-containing protein [Acidimicrobiales bacterium]
MELTSQELRQVEFGSELRGYKTSEVDDFLEKVAVGIDKLIGEMVVLRERVERAERLSSERSGLDDEESIRRTLVLAQRTADLAIKEAQEEAAQLLDGARADAESIVSDARQVADRIVGDADRKLREEVGRLGAERERLRGEVDALGGLLGAERERLTESLSAMLRFVEKNLVPSSETSSFASSTSASPIVTSPDVDELEAAIAADAAAAAPSSSAHLSELDEEWEDHGRLSRPSLMALPTLDELGGDRDDTQPTVSWDFSGEAGSPA